MSVPARWLPAVAIARATWLVTVLSITGALVLNVINSQNHGGPVSDPMRTLTGAFLSVLILAIATFGALIVSRFPRNAIGWVFGVTGLALSLAVPAGVYADTHGALHALPGHAIAAWYANVVAGPNAFCPFIFLLLLFPNGRSLSPRWRKLIWLATADTAATFLITGLVPGPLSNSPSIVNPFGIGLPMTVFNVGLTGTFLLELALVAAGAASFVLRFRRSRGEERLQLKWFLSAVVLLAVIILSGPILWSLPSPIWPITLVFGLTAVLVSVGVSMLRYRLYEIDLIINRALVYGSLTLTLAVAYLLGVVGIQALFRTMTGQSSDLAVAISTLLIAALFNPWRHRLQRFIDRRFYRQKYDAVRALSSFQTRLRDNVDLDDLSTDLATVVSQTVQPSSIALWLAPGETS